MKIKYVAFLLIFFFGTALNAASFDCAKAGTPFEKTICSTPTLSSLDDKLAQMYFAAKAITPNPEQFKADQISWIKGARACGVDVVCIENAYKTRMSALSPTASPSPQNRQTQAQQPSAPAVQTPVTQPSQFTTLFAPPINRSKLMQGVEYVWWPVANAGNLKNSNEKIYLSPTDYEYLCKNSKGQTKHATGLLTYNGNEKAKYLLTNGSIDGAKIFWAPNANHKYPCRLIMTVSGIYKGSSAREVFDGGIDIFLVSENGDILVHGAGSMRY